MVGGWEWGEKQQLTNYLICSCSFGEGEKGIPFRQPINCNNFCLFHPHISLSPVFTFLRIRKAAAVKQSLECSPRMRKVGCSYPGRDRPKSLRQVVVSSPAECSSGNRLGCYKFLNMTLKRMSNTCITADVAWQKNPHWSINMFWTQV